MSEHRDKIIESVWGHLIVQNDMLQRFRNGDVHETVLINEVLDALTTGPLFEEMVERFTEATRGFGPLSIDTWNDATKPIIREMIAHGLRAALGAREG